MKLESRITNCELVDSAMDKDKEATSYRSNDCGPGDCLHRSPMSSSCSSSSLEKASSSVVLIAGSNGFWASGVVLNKSGLILTNAHILEPWRFGRASVLTPNERVTSSSFELYRVPSQRQETLAELETGTHLRSKSRSSAGGHRKSLLSLSYQSLKKLSVRVDYLEQQMWYNAQAIYVSKGPLDVALLQLESTPSHLCPITYELRCPPEGSVVHVVGHGLLGPRSNIASSISSGVLSNVVQIAGLLGIYGSNKIKNKSLSLPVMLQTTAAVHPGASGGAVINSDGHMIGLVTSNARYGGGTIIAHLNFSIPCAALEPIFKFSDNQDSSIFQILDEPNELLSSVWALVPPPSAKTQPESGRKNNNEGKGFRFSQFLAEKNAEIASLKELHHLKKINLPSKI
ncbi:Glyoxysomal processing protease, glyoxysomal [Apostasia shenzhenica]|uniref:Glyoxysomal processing protease, glyoxysomal n=1 Tax=Apostasia shenzhenica TaxID=1088818 RepID=A0A2H9ZTR5_9ASPA|nr:Glyoxysomal processing protease, glyoxysomal [Apostasia shenzhenica]